VTLTSKNGAAAMIQHQSKPSIRRAQGPVEFLAALALFGIIVYAIGLSVRYGIV
jgi:hypothetical protein